MCIQASQADQETARLTPGGALWFDLHPCAAIQPHAGWQEAQVGVAQPAKKKRNCYKELLPAYSLCSCQRRSFESF